MERISQPRLLLHIEGGLILLFSVMMYSYLKGGWGMFFLFLLVPDVAFLGYLVNKDVGRISYNLFHFYLGPFLLFVFGTFMENPLYFLLALIWLAHIGMDRLVGFGLKYPEGRKVTHFNKL